MYVVQSIYFDQYQLYQVIGIPHALTFPLGNDLNYCRPNLPCNYLLYSPRGHLYFRLDIILVKGLSKHTLNTYFPGMKIDPKYAFLHVFFLNFPPSFSKIYDHRQKHTLFSNFGRFCTPKRCTRVHCLVLKNNPNYVFRFTRMISTLKYKPPPLYSWLLHHAMVAADLE